LRWSIASIDLQKRNEAVENRDPLVFTLAETPESARREKPPEKAEHVSDKNAVAQNSSAPQNLPLGKPFAEGVSPDAVAAPQPPENKTDPNHATPANSSSNNKASSEEYYRSENFASSFRREFLTGGQSSPPQYVRAPEAGAENLQSRAPDIGGFSLNTYQWDFAPYMLWLKNHVQRNIHPPAAFTRMGIISGKTVLRFRISRDGILQGMELAGYEGHKSLMETSVRAIQLSAPFRALPHDFPEDYLEVTAHFEYTIRK
jgi:outer membrane biosynthesis protein TonB